ncbi:MAG: hypothetical protein XD93_0107 [candidate division WS6 bacterium 34_10]|jgi:tRNA(Ile2) C34 agmatinyltransferase TiaS|uniref:RNHCP domain-containing protein n=1 Tax=candidate division WS6 bacterium 34_10 TaxID=1641389 RepID=A0A101HJ24_9BACT|nr:MAG: hypothetical protein XD93_0107 [candidate division WS6 bacterium 34_10]
MITSEDNTNSNSIEKLPSKKFERKIEDFVCENCGTEVEGNGYTDHCPNCLYSKHVDVNPGDRAADCGGLMIPKAVEVKSDGYKIYYNCEKCGYKHRVKSSPDDNFELILSLSRNPIPEY